MSASPKKDSSLGLLLHTLPQCGKVMWIGIRPVRRQALQEVAEVEASTEKGLLGDHYAGKYSTTRQVTLIQEEHIRAIASFMGRTDLNPGLLRRNIVVKGINLLALKDKRFRIGGVLLEMTGPCHPCSRMEETLGAGGYNAVRGHGGITARVLLGGMIYLGDKVKVQPEEVPMEG
jgi:MOSC domain-containing protein YiiM